MVNEKIMDNAFGEKSRQNFRIEIENKNTIIKRDYRF